MIEAGSFWKIDPHSHSTRSDGRIAPATRAKLAWQAGLDAYGETDHDVWARQEEPYDDGSTVRLKGVEVTTGIGHLLVFAPPGVNHIKIPMAYSLVETIRRVGGEGLRVVVPHINFGPVPASASVSALRRVYDAGLKVDGIETFHPFLKGKHSEIAEKVAYEFKIAQLGTGDDHTGNIGRRFVTAVPRKTNDPIADFFTALENRETVPVKSDLDLLPTSVSQNALRHTRALFVGLPAKVVASPRFARTIVIHYARELIAK